MFEKFGPINRATQISWLSCCAIWLFSTLLTTFKLSLWIYLLIFLPGLYLCIYIRNKLIFKPIQIHRHIPATDVSMLEDIADWFDLLDDETNNEDRRVQEKLRKIAEQLQKG